MATAMTTTISIIIYYRYQDNYVCHVQLALELIKANHLKPG